ncbi:MAG TPA: hypothetical protein VFZ77_10690 [Acidimicrobiales bacterium]
MGDAVLELREVCKRYGGVVALDRVDLDVVSGVQSPTSGTVTLAGEQIGSHPPELRARRGIRRTLQRVQLYPRLSVEDNVVTAMEWRGGGGGLLADLVGAPSRRRREAARRARAAEVLAAYLG